MSFIIAAGEDNSSAPSSQSSGAAGQAGQKVVWTGKGKDSHWTNGENWSTGTQPGPDDDVILNGTSNKDCFFDGPRTSKAQKYPDVLGQEIGSLTVTKEYGGTFRIRQPGQVKRSVKLAGKLAVEYDIHTRFVIDGPELDLSGLTSVKTEYSGGSLSLGASSGVQTLIQPDPSIMIPHIAKINGGTLKLTGKFNSVMLEIDNKSEVDLNGNDVTVQLLQIAGPVKNLGGRTITVTCAIGYYPCQFGATIYGKPAEKQLDLAPETSWKLIRKEEQYVRKYGNLGYEFYFENCRVGNCDASEGSTVYARKKSVDAGGNKNVTFGEPPPASKPADQK